MARVYWEGILMAEQKMASYNELLSLYKEIDRITNILDSEKISAKKTRQLFKQGKDTYLKFLDKLKNVPDDLKRKPAVAGLLKFATQEIRDMGVEEAVWNFTPDRLKEIGFIQDVDMMTGEPTFKPIAPEIKISKKAAPRPAEVVTPEPEEKKLASLLTTKTQIK